MKRWLVFLFSIVPTLLLSGCMVKPIDTPGTGGGFDLTAFVRNPIVMAIIIIVVLLYMFRKK